jgi:hypothetical protein
MCARVWYMCPKVRYVVGVVTMCSRCECVRGAWVICVQGSMGVGGHKCSGSGRGCCG